ncbi:GumC family protein [Mucilaginibacter antarcticus]|uniref:GumC family protein n=1 Tax=Mucilaginibacter antarcticus TaxID=1855725 RepID=UPI003630FB8B
MNNNTQLSTFAIEKEKKQPVNFKNIINNYKHHWYIFLGSVLICLVIAFVYLQYVAPVYTIKATLLINENKENNTQEDKSVLNKIDLPNSSEITENEIAKLKSTNLIGQVVSDLQLATSYKIKDGWKYNDLYETLPFKFVMLAPHKGIDGKHTLTIRIKDQKSFAIDVDGKSEEHKFNTSISSDLGTWTLKPTSEIVNFKNAEIKLTMLDPDKITTDYQKAIDASLKDKLSSAVDLTITDHIKQRGKDILNHLIYVYNNSEVQAKNKETQSTIAFIDQRLSSLTGELSSSERNIQDFKSSNQITDIDATSKYNLDNLQVNDARLNEINVQLSVIKGIEKYIESPQNRNNVPAVIGISDPTLVSSVEKLSQLELERQKLLATTPETNPDFEQLNRQIQTTRASIKENVQNIKSSLNNALEKIQSVNTNVESKISSIPIQERELLGKKRQQSIKENLYLYLLQKREEVSLNYATTLKNYRVIDNAFSGPVKWPIKSIVYFVALMLGLLLPIIFIFVKDMLNGVIVDPETLENETGLAILTDINVHKSENPFVLTDKNNNLISEQFRALRSELFYLNKDKELSNVILITSSVAAEGKSFISSNLSIALASTGKKVVLIDLDLRRPKLKTLLNN